MTQGKRSTWLLFCFLLYLPFLFEIVAVAPLILWREPLWLWSALYWVHTYITYGLVCFFHAKWRRSIGEPITLRAKKANSKWIILSIAIGVVVGHLADFIFGYGFVPPMLIREFIGAMRLQPLWMGIAYFVMQNVYYLSEFTLVAFMVDCVQQTSSRLGWAKRIPWGGMFLALTWGFGHAYSKGVWDLNSGLHSLVLALAIGAAYMLPGKKPLYAWLAIAAGYWL